MKRPSWIVLSLIGAFLPSLAAGQGSRMTDCLTSSALAGVEGAARALLTPGLPEVDVSSVNVVLGLKVVQACTINETVRARNARYKKVLGAEVLENHRLDSLFHKVELVIHYGDAPGTEVALGGSDLRFLSLVPTMLQSSWLRQGITGAGAGRRAAPGASAMVTGTSGLVTLFGSRQSSYAMDAYQASVEGSETALAAALTAEDNATDAATMLSTLEAELQRGTPSSGRAKQLRALAAVRTALMTNQRLRLAASTTRSATDVAMTAGIESPMRRLSMGHAGTGVRP